MSKNLEFGLVISADGTAAISTLDKIDTGLDKVDKTASKSGTSTGKTFDRLRQRANQTQSSLKRMGRSLVSLAGKATMFGTAFAGVVGVVAGGQLGLAKEVKQFSQLANVNVERFQELSAGAKQYGVEQDKLADILKDTNDKVGDFMQTSGGAMADFFENIAPKVGVTKEMFQGLSGSDALQLYYDSLEKANVSQADMVFYLEAIASDATLLQPLLANNGAEFDRLGKSARDAGMIMSEMDIQNATKISGTLGKVKQMFEGFKVSAFKAVMPTLLSLSEAFEANQDKIMGWIGGFSNGFSSVINSVAEVSGVVVTAITDFMQLPTVIEAVNVASDILTASWQAVKDGIQGVTDLIVPVIDWFKQHEEISIALGTGLLASATAFGAFTLAVGAWSAVGTLATAVTTGFGAAVALVTSPVTLTLAAIAGLVAVGVLLYRNWDTIKAKATEVFNSLPAPVQEAFANIKQTFSTLKQWATSAFDFLAPYVRTTMGVVSALFTAKWSLIKGGFSTAFGAIKGIVTTNFNVIKAVLTTGISVLATVFNTGFNLVKNTVKTAFNAIKALARGDIEGFKNTIKNGLDRLKGIAQNAMTKFTNAFKTLGTKLYQIGSDVVQGLINGLKAKFTQVKNIATDMANTVLSALNIGFDRHSPAKKTIAIGLDVGEGLIIGIANKKSKAYQTAKQLANTVLDAMAILQKEIDLFGNDSPLASFDYDLDMGKYEGLNPKIIADYRALIEAKEDLIATSNRESEQADAQTKKDDTLEKFAERQQKSLSDYAFETSLIGKNADEVERLRLQRNLLNQATQAGIDLSNEDLQSLIAQREELSALREQQIALQSNDWVDGIRTGLQSLVDNAKTLNQTMQEATTSTFNKMSDGIANFVATGKGNFKDLTVSILQDISKMLIKFAMLRLAKMALGMFENGGAFGGGGLLEYAKGGAFNGQGIQYYANGDIFNRPTAFSHAGGLGVMGEAGPEAVMPRTRGANGKLGVQVYGNKQNTQSAGVVNQVQIDVNINNEGTSSDVQTTSQDGKQLAESLKAVVIKTLTDEIRPGGMLSAR